MTHPYIHELDDRDGDDSHDDGLDNWIDARTLDTDEIADALRAQACGSLAHEAAVELLISHGTWLRRNGFRDQLDIRPTWDRCTLAASIDWDAVTAAGLAASSSEEQILAIAGELAGHDSGQPLGHLVSGLDDTNIALVVRAVLHTSGCRSDRPEFDR